MELPSRQWHIAVATDLTDISRYGSRAGARLAELVDGRVTIISVEAQHEPDPGVGPGRRLEEEHDRLRRWAAPDMGTRPWSAVVRTGLPGIEISRFAEEEGVDLLILVRKPRSKMSRALSGDTVDSVARRSVVPCLMVPPTEIDLNGFLIALDGTDRGLVVLREAVALAQATGRPIVPVTVEPRRSNEPASLAAQLPTGRSMHLQRSIADIAEGDPTEDIVIRRGTVVEELLLEEERRAGFVLAIGYHRGGPPGVIEAGSIGRQLVHRSSAPVLTIPL